MSSQTPYPTFGQKEPGAHYIHRPGAYAVFVDEHGRVALSQDDGLLFLPGGGIEAGETPESCLTREVKEELAALVKILWPIGQAGEYIYTGKPHERDYYFKLGHFFYAQMWEFGQHGTPEYPVKWLPLAQAAEAMNHLSHRWAIQQIQKVSHHDGN